MPKTLPNGLVIQTATDRFNHQESLRKIALPVGAIPAVATRQDAKNLVEQIKADPAYSGDFAWLIYVRNEDRIYFHDGSMLRES